jgi:hypothetical protein
MPARIDFRTITTAVFLPLLYWTGVVIAVTIFGYPGVVCMTPVAWLLALPIGTRVGRDSESRGFWPVLEGALGGGALGLWQGLLFAAAMAASPYLPNGGVAMDDLPSPLFVALMISCIGSPVTAGLAALMAWIVIKKKI